MLIANPCSLLIGVFGRHVASCGRSLVTLEAGKRAKLSAMSRYTDALAQHLCSGEVEEPDLAHL